MREQSALRSDQEKPPMRSSSTHRPAFWVSCCAVTAKLTLGLTLGLALGCSAGLESDDLDQEIEPGEAASALRLTGTATASSSQTTSLIPANAVDGNLSTRWSSAFSDPQWIRVDLGSVQSISRVVLRWEAAYSSNYEIQFSNDAVTWTKKYGDTAGNGGVDDLAVSGSARYVRMYSTRRGTAYGNSLYEFEVHSATTTPPPPPPPPPPPTTTAVALPARIEAERYVRFFDTTAGNSGTASCSSTNVDAQTTTDSAGGTCNIAWTAATEWLEYDVSAGTTANFDITARLAANKIPSQRTVLRARA